MQKIGAYEAKTHLPRLLKLVARGEKIIITKHGVPVATLQPPDTVKRAPVREVIEQLREFRRNKLLDGPTLKELIEEGRR